jgi:hypothetical protein
MFGQSRLCHIPSDTDSVSGAFSWYRDCVASLFHPRSLKTLASSGQVFHQVRCRNQQLPHHASKLPCACHTPMICACSSNARCARTQSHFHHQVVCHAGPRETVLDQLYMYEGVVEALTKLTRVFQPFPASSDARGRIAQRLNSLSVTVSRAPGWFHSAHLERIFLTGTID